MDITAKGLEHTYNPRTPFEKRAIYNMDLSIQSGSYTAIIGHTGSGKSTLLQHLNGLLKPTSGWITIGDRTIKAKEKAKHLKTVRKKVGIVFQFPEHQLFEETVEKDIMFGPMNFGVPEKEARQRAREMTELVGLPSEVLERSPFDLSGGQMRRVAIAGVLAMEPEVIVLDEPTAGLDPKGRRDIMELFYQLHKEKGLTTILVTHSMEDAARYAEELIVLHQGTIQLKGRPEEVFSAPEKIAEAGLRLPETVQFKHALEEKLGIRIQGAPLTIDETVRSLKSLYKKGGAE
ncbi:energy-coupling factor ABC transporter ATP-binding protein [Bacillus sp. FJAT-42376]|uniref:energy-coupling factor ABC transporter ATP-binding protein n=1 Tax=Bacillus sp. FJAT-42376 TaxID=2014076 RepID=UPI000F4DB788|nr:energy-coupling factor ABC transporter ATP-binding protein [Bacillus sp. FJAT-42376]AZB41284.1 energy-coupling factor ABC transporter ATP-binding protein [Bacillus sp. FJAT-42376]